MFSPSSRALITSAALLLASSCTRAEPPGAGIAPAANTAGSTLLPTASAPATRPATSAVEEPAGSGSNAAAPGDSAAGEPTLVDPENKALPARDGPELEQSARSLFDAIVADDPEKARDFFFPREPFSPLKDVRDPDRYWRQLYRTYELDIHKLHGKRRDWSGAVFEAIELGSPPSWVKPGDEYNKIGYHRTFGAMLRYRVDGTRYTIKVHTLISWNGRWTITHLLPFKKK